MPTAARLFSAVALAILAFIVSGQAMPLMPEGTDFGMFTYVNIAVGAVMGWVVVGKRAGRGLIPGITNGMTGMLTMMFWCLCIYGAYEMFSRAMDRRYDDPFESVMAIFELGFDYALMIFVQNIIVTLLIGGVLTGLAAEYAAKRFR